MTETLFRLKPREWTEKVGVATAWNTTHRVWSAPAGGFANVVIFEDACDDAGKRHPFVWLASFDPLRTGKHGCDTFEKAKADAEAWADGHVESRVLTLFEPVTQEASVE